jgi:hypothetical protein
LIDKSFVTYTSNPPFNIMPTLKELALAALAVVGVVSMPVGAPDEDFEDGFNATSLIDRRYVTPNSVGKSICCCFARVLT